MIKDIFPIIITVSIFGPIYLGSFFFSRRMKEPPEVVKIAGYIEAVHAAFFYIFSFGFIFYLEKPIQPKNLIITWAFFYLISICWFFLAIQLMKGNRNARRICLIVSTLRALAVIGIPFSFFSIRFLYFSKEGKEFFSKKSKIKKL